MSFQEIAVHIETMAVIVGAPLLIGAPASAAAKDRRRLAPRGRADAKREAITSGKDGEKNRYCSNPADNAVFEAI
jgi:hypothetical protein